MLKRLGLLLLGLVLISSTAEASTILESTDSLEVVTSSTAAIDYTASWADHTSTTFVPGKSAGQITTATTTTVVAAPAASTQRQIKQFTLRNASTTTSNTITVQRDVSATNRTMFSFSLAAGEWMDMDSNGTMLLYNASGQTKVAEIAKNGVNGKTYQIRKVGTAKDTVGYNYWTGKDAGIPGAFGLQAPGVNGFTTDCSIATQTTDPNGATQMGAHLLEDPVSGSWYLTSMTFTETFVGNLELIDVLWYNTGLTVTTTTEQTFTQPTLPSRSTDGTNNGAGVNAALYALTALGNAAAVANTTIRYTDQSGNGSSTGTFQAQAGFQAPVTPVIGTWMPFSLAAGDWGIRTIQGITLGTSYTSGTMSLVMYRTLASLGLSTANAGATITFAPPGVKVWPNSCLYLVDMQTSSTTLATYTGTYSLVEQ